MKGGDEGHALTGKKRPNLLCALCTLIDPESGWMKTKYVFYNYDDLFDHLEQVHDLIVVRAGETEKEAEARVKAKNPRMGSAACRCPSCEIKRKTGIV
jgi:hypothetical protein